jgi:hypothetical protein
MHRRTLLRTALGSAAASALPFSSVWAQDLPAITLDGAETILDKASIKAFAESLDGVLLKPDSVGYDIARQVWNRFWDRKPALIAKVTNVTDVVNAVAFARENNLLTAVRCGGHSMSGKGVCDGGLVIDMSAMNRVDIDVDKQVATLQGGCLLGDLDRKSLGLGLATTAGVVSHTGAGGLILGGGMGRLQRHHGLSIDNVLSVQIVTADGRVLTANAQENPDLYWGVRGGGGNFGVVTEIQMRLHKQDPMVMAFGFSYPMEHARDAMKLYLDAADGAPVDLFLLGGFGLEGDGSGGVSISGTFFGAASDLEKHLAQFRTGNMAISERAFPIPYVNLQRVADDGVNAPGLRRYAKGGFLRQADESMIDAMIGMAEPLPGRSFRIGLLPMDAAPSRVGPTDTVWAHRDALYNIDASSTWALGNEEDDERNISANRAYFRGIEEFSQGFYVNSLVDESQTQVNENYRQNYDRMVEVKTKYDPANLFRLNANVRPAA